MLLFYIILAAWVYQALFQGFLSDLIYMITSLVSWSVVCYFINRQDVVIKAVACGGDSESADVQTSEVQTFSLPSETESSVPSAVATSADVQIAQCIQKAFDEDKVYLNPKLRLSDLAARIQCNC